MLIIDILADYTHFINYVQKWLCIFYHFMSVVCIYFANVSQLHFTWVTQMVQNIPVNKITKLNFTILTTQIPCKLDTYKLLFTDLCN